MTSACGMGWQPQPSRSLNNPPQRENRCLSACCHIYHLWGFFLMHRARVLERLSELGILGKRMGFEDQCSWEEGDVEGVQ